MAKKDKTTFNTYFVMRNVHVIDSIVSEQNWYTIPCTQYRHHRMQIVNCFNAVHEMLQTNRKYIIQEGNSCKMTLLLQHTIK